MAAASGVDRHSGDGGIGASRQLTRLSGRCNGRIDGPNMTISGLETGYELALEVSEVECTHVVIGAQRSGMADRSAWPPNIRYNNNLR
jgi:hypothetical protein